MITDSMNDVITQLNEEVKIQNTIIEEKLDLIQKLKDLRNVQL